MRNLLVLAPALTALLVLASCGLKPAQDYVVIGTLNVAPAMQRFVVSGQRTGGETVLVMTLRTSPDVKDVVVQRRWINPSFPLEFGLGKGRGTEFRGGEFYVTAELSGLPSGSLVGFSPEPVPAGAAFIELTLARQGGDATASAEKGHPIGGFVSKSIREEALPPGREPVEHGPLVFSGRVEMPEPFASRMGTIPITIMSRPKADRTAPNLIVKVERPSYPLEFALHQYDRIQMLMGQEKEAQKIGRGDPVEWDSFVIAQIDLDGSVDTKDDQIEVASEKIAPGTSGIVLRFTKEALEAAVATMGDGQHGDGQHGGGQHGGGDARPANPHGGGDELPAATGPLARGRIELPAALADKAAGAELWLSIRDPESQKMMDAYRFQVASFPFEFELENGKGMMNVALRPGQKFLIRAILTKEGPMSATALMATSPSLEPGAEGLVLELATQ